MNLKRDRYQHGSLTTEPRRNGPDVWVYRWREVGPNGTSRHPKRIIGTVKNFPTESAAWKRVESLKLDINAETVASSALTIREVADHYISRELPKGKTVRTQETYRQHLRNYIVPRWGSERLGNIKAFRVEDWLASLNGANGTKSKTKAVFSVLFQHAMRYGWAERNPIAQVRQSAKRQNDPDILTPAEMQALLSILPSHARVMAIVAGLTGLRRGELIGLQWACRLRELKVAYTSFTGRHGDW